MFLLLILGDCHCAWRLHGFYHLSRLIAFAVHMHQTPKQIRWAILEQTTTLKCYLEYRSMLSLEMCIFRRKHLRISMSDKSTSWTMFTLDSRLASWKLHFSLPQTFVWRPHTLENIGLEANFGGQHTMMLGLTYAYIVELCSKVNLSFTRGTNFQFQLQTQMMVYVMLETYVRNA